MANVSRVEASTMVVAEPVGLWSVDAVVFALEWVRIPLSVHGVIGNSVPTSESGKARLINWKRKVAGAAKRSRGKAALDPRRVFAISAGFSFHLPTHGNAGLEVENFLKPTFDALAAGLFCDDSVDCNELTRFNYDDTGFRYLFVHRLADAPQVESEGVGFVVSIRS